ncbi:isochorismatase family protein [Pseudomonas aeruginosa]|uniref:isochorismatase family protein n=1 Tax=Pseudomonas aeruginosa TaxID=287 RepID=UPI000EB1D668|nr:isochorismatase family protein [Pseudomonas aeruginosa]NNB83763.1 isochorismatase family protein [Pseudomonas aeruginosa]
MTPTLFDQQDSVVVLMDYQQASMSWMRARPLKELKGRVLLLARTARFMKIPVLITTHDEAEKPGPVIPELERALTLEHGLRIQRTGLTSLIDATSNPQFVEAIRRTGRKHVVLAGANNATSTVFTAVALRDLGFDVLVVIDAGSAQFHAEHARATRELNEAGVALTTTNELLRTQLTGGRMLSVIMGGEGASRAESGVPSQSPTGNGSFHHGYGPNGPKPVE